MTKSTGKRERQRRREELLGAEMRLSRVLLHILSAQAWADRLQDKAERDGLVDAQIIVYRSCYQIVAEQEELRWTNRRYRKTLDPQ